MPKKLGLIAMRVFLLILLVALVGCRQPQTPEQLAAQQNVADDTTCKSYGLQFGAPQYADCRLRLKQMHAAEADRQAQIIAQSDPFAAWVASQPFRAPVTTTCNSTGTGSATCTTR